MGSKCPQFRLAGVGKCPSLGVEEGANVQVVNFWLGGGGRNCLVPVYDIRKVN